MSPCLLDSPPKPKLTPVKVEVTEGSSVSLSCSAAAPCPKLPPTLTWTPRLSDSEDQLQENQDQTKSVSSVLTFTASHLHHGQKITCTALYKLQQGDTQKTSEASLTLSVLAALTCSSNANPPVQSYTWYKVNGTEMNTVWTGQNLTFSVTKPSDSGQYYYPPKNTSVSFSPSGPVLEGSSVTLTCSSNANPPVQSYTWYKVNGTEMNTVGTGQNLTFSVTKPSDSGQYYCEAQNEHGMENSTTALLDISGSGSCSRTAAEISCSCESRGNPSPSMEWRVSGLRVTNSTDRVIREEQLGNTGLRSSLTMRHSQGDTPTLLCLSTNTVGSSSLQLLVPSQQWNSGHTHSCLVSPEYHEEVAGKLKEPLASQVPINMTDQAQPSNETAEETGPMQADEEQPILPLTAPTTEEDPIYANHTMATAKPKETQQKEPDQQEKPGTEAQNTAESDTLHYASVKFSVRRNDPEPPPAPQGNPKPSSTLRETHKSDSKDPKPPSKPGQEGHGGAASPEPEAVYAQVMVKRKTKKVKAEEKQQREGEGAGPVSYLEEEQVLGKSNKKTRSMAQEEMNSLYVEMGKGKDTEGEYTNVGFKKKDAKR
ncbi:hypothetical protein JZ751_022164 [Albula glossodonta]|uniref:Ig-like domain-containing protein n=1 Tax=Albula glossodonta TaxID=121402 RepID=A0A8T2N2H8_9TELE|nr:hypothetical protein JZ751_022164 [Albula glossodonta]